MPQFFIPRKIGLPKRAAASYRSVAQATLQARAQPAGRASSTISGPSGASSSTSVALLRAVMGHGSRVIQCAQVSTMTYSGSNNGQTGWYDLKLAAWQGKGSSGTPDTETDWITASSASLAGINLNQLTLSSDTGQNNPPILNLKGPLIISGALIANDQGTPAKKTLVFDSDGVPSPAPGVIVTSTFANTYPQQYNVQQASDSSSDSSGTGTVTMTGMTNAPTWAVTNLSQFAGGGPRLPNGARVNVFFGYNNAGVLKPYMNEAAMVGGLVYVALSSDGTGSLGSDSASSSWKYYMTDLNGTAFGVSSGGGLSPLVGRINGTFAAASYGIGYVNSSGVPKLLFAFELPGTTHC